MVYYFTSMTFMIPLTLSTNLRLRTFAIDISKKPNFLDIQASKRFSLAIETHRNQILSKITFVYIFVKAILLSTLTYISTCDLMRKSLHYFLVKITFLTCHNLSKTKTKSLFKTNIRSLLKD